MQLIWYLFDKEYSFITKATGSIGLFVFTTLRIKLNFKAVVTQPHDFKVKVVNTGVLHKTIACTLPSILQERQTTYLQHSTCESVACLPLNTANILHRWYIHLTISEKSLSVRYKKCYSVNCFELHLCECFYTMRVYIPTHNIRNNHLSQRLLFDPERMWRHCQMR